MTDTIETAARQVPLNKIGRSKSRVQLDTAQLKGHRAHLDNLWRKIEHGTMWQRVAWFALEDISNAPPFEPWEWDDVVASPKRNKGTAGRTENTIWHSEEDELSKRLKLGKNGELVKTPEANLWKGWAERVPIADLSELAQVIRKIGKFESPSLGRLRADLPDKVEVTTKDRLNGSTGVIARAREFTCYEEGCAAIVLLDYDTHDKPSKIVVKDFWNGTGSAQPGHERLVERILCGHHDDIHRLDRGRAVGPRLSPRRASNITTLYRRLAEIG
jgi:hypothetical protein